MARYISQEVSDLIEEAGDDGPHDLVVVVEESELDQALTRADEYGLQVKSQIDPNILVLEIELSQIESFSQPDYFRSVSLDNEMEVLGSGNLSHPPA